jgi:hypothetical protein
MNARMERVCLRGTLLAALIGSAGCFGDTADTPLDPECIIDEEGEKRPGDPYDYELYKTDIAPLLVQTCTVGNCHLPGTPPTGANGGFIVYPNAASDPCDSVKTFRSFDEKSDETTVENSRTLYAINGGLAIHPAKAADNTLVGGQATLDKIQGFIQNAHDYCVENGGCAPAGALDYFDYQVYQDVIQPGLDKAGNNVGCSAGATCHAPPGQLGLALTPNPAKDSPEMEANYASVKSKIAVPGATDPTTTIFYINAVTAHGGGVSTQIDGATQTALADFIQKAIDAAEGRGDETCADPAQLDIGVFENEILPMLRGERDYNDLGADATATGCVRAPCHGTSRPASLTLIPTDPVETQLANFACFVNLVSPSASQVLLCPTLDPRCVKHPHPGDRIFDGAEDQNYRKLLGFLFSTNNTANTPTDLGFFARKINGSIFDNRAAVEDGAQGRTCADTNDCHGIAVAGQAPPNRSNFGILPNAGDNLAQLESNFFEATAFINFLEPEASSLFQYPTNLIAEDDPDINPFGTGINHPGGEAFAVDSQFALDILTWAQGLRLINGFNRNWLIAGSFQGADDIDFNTPIDEETETPAIFENSRGQDLAGKWDALFEIQDNVDVATFIDSNVEGQIAYAVAYVFNTTNVEQEVNLTINSINEVEVHFGGSQTRLAPNQEGTLTAFIPPTRAEDPAINRILIKMFQGANDGGMSFTAQLLNENDEQFNDTDIIIKTSELGGI